MIRNVLPLLLCVGLAACNTSAGMFEDESDGTPARTNSVSSLLTMTGMVASPKAPIEYTPRAPLAMPGSKDLPSPTERSSAEDAVNFPVDQDTKDAEAIAKIHASGLAVDNSDTGRALPGEVQATLPAGANSRIDRRNMHGQNDNKPLSREQMQVVVKNPNRAPLLNEDGTAAPRATLAMPPSSYRTANGTAGLPDKKDIENSEWIRKQLYQKENRQSPRMTGQPGQSALDRVLR